MTITSTRYDRLARNLLLSVFAFLHSCAPGDVGLEQGATEVAVVSQALLSDGTAYKDIVLSDDPKGYWRLGEPPGESRALDASRNGRHGTYLARTAPSSLPQLGVPGAIGGDSDTAARFFWHNDYQVTPVTQWNYMEVPYHSSLVPPAPAFSLEAWFTMPPQLAHQTYSGIIASSTANGQDGYGIFYYAYQIWFFIGHINARVGFPMGLVAPDRFNHIVATWDGRTATIYLDGTVVASKVVGYLNPGTGPLHIGKWWIGGWQGAIDEAAIYHHVLDDRRVLAHYRAGARKPDPNCARADREGHTYWLCQTPRSFDAARANCEAAGLQLVSIDSADENTFAASRAQDHSYIGLANEAQEDVWNWLSDDRPGWCGAAGGFAPLRGYAAWGAGQPLDGGGAARCAQLRAATGQWESADCATSRGYVCEALEPEPEGGWFAAESDGPLYHRSNYSLATAQLTAGLDADTTVRRYRDELRMRDCVDDLEPASAPRPTGTAGEEATYYQHTYKGLPVLGSGYMLLRERATGTVTELSGRLEPSIEADVNPQIAKEQAVVAAAQAVEHPRNAYPAIVEAELALAPVPDAAGEQTYRLVWQVSLPPVANDGAYLVSVDASTGEVVRFASSRVTQCASINTVQPPGPASPMLGHIFTLDTQDGDPDELTLTKYAAPGGNQYGLLAYGLLAPNGAPFVGDLATEPQVRAICEGHDPIASAVELPDHTFASEQDWPPDAHAAATYTAMVQQVLEYWNARHQLPETDGSVPWTGFDGSGDAPVLITLDRTSEHAHAGTYYDPSAPKRIGLNPDIGDVLQLESAGHEFAHAVWDTLVSRAKPTQSVHTSLPESRALNEGFSDVFGTAVEWYVRGADRRDFCFRPSTPLDPLNPDAPRRCVMDLQKPANSISTSCKLSFAKGTKNTVPEPNGTCPAMYAGPGFCVDTDTRTCDVHHNGTIVGRWVYNLVHPETVEFRDDLCGVTIPDIDPGPVAGFPNDPEKQRFERATKILFIAARDFYIPNGNFAAFASATVAAARKVGGDDLANAVVAAWYSVNVWDLDYERIAGDPAGIADNYSPRNGARDVPPWPTFMWRADPSIDAWNLQVDTTPRFNSSDRVQQLDIDGHRTLRLGDNEFVVANGIALPANSSQRYYWRAVPANNQQATPPIDCYPIHFIESTGNVPKVDEVLNTKDGFVEVLPGFSQFEWVHIPGATKYLLQVAERDTACNEQLATTHIANVRAALSTEKVSTTVEGGLEPERQDYYLMIRPIGPKNANGDETQGECQTFRVRTLPMRAPLLLNPEDRGYNYYSPHSNGSENLQWKWIGYDVAQRYELRFYERDADGDCQGPPIVHRVDEPCSLHTCAVTVAEDLLPSPNPAGPGPNAKGYCWEVVSYASNNSFSVSASQGKFHYVLPTSTWFRHEVLGEESAGVNLGYIQITGYPPELRTLGNDSYGEKVTLKWEPLPHDVSKYMVKLGKWPWLTPISPPEPINCSGCYEEPSEVTLRRLVEGTELSDVPVSEGRYCWTVWPLLDGDEQPLLGFMPTICYTTGPAKPVFEFKYGEPPPDSDGFKGDEIQFEIAFPYLPEGKRDAKMDGFVAGGLTVQLSPECEVEVVGPDPQTWTPDKAYIFGDLYGCKATVTFTPLEGETYKITGITFGKDDEPIEHLLKEFTMGTCGAETEACCEPSNGSGECENVSTNLVCNDEDRCVRCGVDGLPCCDHFEDGCSAGDSSHCDEPTQTCERCGDAARQPCCHGNSCTSDLNCNFDSGLCESCGGRGQPCCTNRSPVCNGADACQNGLCRCVPEACGTRNCGHHVPDGCGGELDCGNCFTNCLNYHCEVPPTPTCADRAIKLAAYTSAGEFLFDCTGTNEAHPEFAPVERCDPALSGVDRIHFDAHQGISNYAVVAQFYRLENGLWSKVIRQTDTFNVAPGNDITFAKLREEAGAAQRVAISITTLGSCADNSLWYNFQL